MTNHALFPPPDDLLLGASLFLDFDGTLVEIAERPDAVRVDARLAAIVQGLRERLHGRLAVITGRPAAQVGRLLASDVIVVGSHGMEFMGLDRQARPAKRPSQLCQVLAAMQAFARRKRGLIVEEKPLGVALHYRQAPLHEEECIALAAELADRHALRLQPGKMMIEVRAAGGDKGSAIETLMQEPDMARTRPVFMGDDLTDEPGFAAANRMGGVGVLVGEPRVTAALYRLEGVEAALAWLEAASAKAT